MSSRLPCSCMRVSCGDYAASGRSATMRGGIGFGMLASPRAEHPTCVLVHAHPALCCCALPRRSSPPTKPATGRSAGIGDDDAVDSQIRLDEKGTRCVQIEPGSPDVLRQKLERMVGALAIRADACAGGIARSITSPMRLTLAATKVGEGYRVKVDNVISRRRQAASAGARRAWRGITASAVPAALSARSDRGGVSGVVRAVPSLTGADGRSSSHDRAIEADQRDRPQGGNGRPSRLRAVPLIAAAAGGSTCRRRVAQAPAPTAHCQCPGRLHRDRTRQAGDQPGAEARSTAIWRVEVPSPFALSAGCNSARRAEKAPRRPTGDGEDAAVGLVKLDTDVSAWT